jgi:hypothetical protein
VPSAWFFSKIDKLSLLKIIQIETTDFLRGGCSIKSQNITIGEIHYNQKIIRALKVMIYNIPMTTNIIKNRLRVCHRYNWMNLFDTFDDAVKFDIMKSIPRPYAKSN